MIDSFYGENKFLSNFYGGGFYYNGLYYKTNEHWFQANKAHNLEEHEEIRTSKTPSDAKYLGRTCIMKHNWEDIKYDIMYQGLILKFTQNPSSLTKLLETGNEELVEGNNHGDTCWGVCRGKGTNWLGKLLMLVREELLDFGSIYLETKGL